MLTKTRVWFYIHVTLLVALSLVPFQNVAAKPNLQQGITSPSQLIDAVNGLRLAYGLQPLTIHPLLMQSAQSQAEPGRSHMSARAEFPSPSNCWRLASRFPVTYPLAVFAQRIF